MYFKFIMKHIHKNFFRFLLPIFFLLFIFFNLTVPAYGIDDTPSEKTIYLTFDDGPSKGPCNEILDILKSENVKATFFVVGKEIKGNEETLKRMANEGHSIGLHSMTHEKHNLYNNDSDFLKEMLSTQEIILKETGCSSTILRFPFGANNNTYKLKKSLVNLLHENNLKIYDWTLDSQDGEHFNADPSLFIKSSISKDPNITLLMHCGGVNKNSPKALKSIITHYKQNNYTFKVIDASTPELYHYIRA